MPAYEPGGAPGAIGRTCRRVMKSAPTPYARMLFRPASAWEGAACVCERWAREVEERAPMIAWAGRWVRGKVGWGSHTRQYG